MGVNSLPNKTVTRQRRGCDSNPGPTAPESSKLTSRLPVSFLSARIGPCNITFQCAAVYGRETSAQWPSIACVETDDARNYSLGCLSLRRLYQRRSRTERSIFPSYAAEGVSGWGHHGECGARAYNEGLGAEPPAGSRGSGGEAP